jgi:hypothetical protein
VVHNDSALVVAQSHFTWGFGEGLAFLAQPCSARSSQYFCEVQVPRYSAKTLSFPRQSNPSPSFCDLLVEGYRSRR